MIFEARSQYAHAMRVHTRAASIDPVYAGFAAELAATYDVEVVDVSVNEDHVPTRVNIWVRTQEQVDRFAVGGERNASWDPRKQRWITAHLPGPHALWWILPFETAVLEIAVKRAADEIRWFQRRPSVWRVEVEHLLPRVTVLLKTDAQASRLRATGRWELWQRSIRASVRRYDRLKLADPAELAIDLMSKEQVDRDFEGSLVNVSRR